MKTPDKKNQDISSFNPLQTPRTEATNISRSTSSMKNQKSPNTLRIEDLTQTMNNTRLGISDQLMSEPAKNNQKKK